MGSVCNSDWPTPGAIPRAHLWTAGIYDNGRNELPYIESSTGG